jgi:hypothetical protein
MAKVVVEWDSGAGHVIYRFRCPACGYDHHYTVRSDGVHPSWTFNGDTERPTFAPSLRYLSEPKCHLTVTEGQAYFHGDSPQCGGQTLPLQDVADWKPWGHDGVSSHA